MQIAWSEVISRARLYIDDDHAETNGWIADPKWLIMAQVEYEQLYRRWIRSGLIGPEPTDVLFTGPSTDLDGVLAIVGVAAAVGTVTVGTDPAIASGQFRTLRPLQVTNGRKPFRNTLDVPGLGWEAFGTGDACTVRVRPDDSSGQYVVRFLSTPERTTDASDTVEVPFGGDERLVLGLARRAMVKESGSSALINGLIQDADAELNFSASARNGTGWAVRVPERRRGYAALWANWAQDRTLWAWF